jgi:hypothetical protein
MRLPALASSLSLLVLIGCTSQLSVRVPTLAGGATYAQDLETCEKTTPPGIDQRGERFAGCMVAAGHGAWVEVATGEEFLVRQTRPHDRKVAEDEVAECYKITKDESTFASCLGPRGYTIQRWDARYRR